MTVEQNKPNAGVTSRFLEPLREGQTYLVQLSDVVNPTTGYGMIDANVLVTHEIHNAIVEDILAQMVEKSVVSFNFRKLEPIVDVFFSDVSPVLEFGMEEVFKDFFTFRFDAGYEVEHPRALKFADLLQTSAERIRKALEDAAKKRDAGGASP